MTEAGTQNPAIAPDIQALITDDEAVLFNPFLPEVRADPYPHYRHLREAEPVHMSPFGVCVLTRYQDCVGVLRDHERFSNDRDNAEDRTDLQTSETIAALRELRGQRDTRSMLFLDPPDHTRMRSLVTKAFTPRRIESLRPRMHEIVDSLLDAVQDAGSMDLISDLAYPLPVTVIAEMLGVPSQDRLMFRDWSRDLVASIDPLPSLEVAQKAVKAADELGAYFAGLIAERRKEPRDDLLTALVKAEGEEGRLTPDEVIVTCNLLLVAGHETTMNLIGNGTLALLRSRDQFDRLKDDPSLIRTAVEELLRYDSPVQVDGRTSLVELEIDGVPIRKGQTVITVIGAANRDPAQFDDPDRLDLARKPNHHIAFGAGIHFCLGAPLARVEGQIAFESLLKRMPNLEVATDQPEWRETVTLRGLKSLPVTF